VELNIIYTASLDTTAKVITSLVIIAAIALCHWSIRSLRKAKGDILAIIMHVFIVFLVVAIPIGSYLYSPRKYVVGNFDIVVNRPIGDVVVHVTDIMEIRAANPGEMSETTRTFGVGGLFGYYGNYATKRGGPMSWYATNYNNLVIIHTKQGETIVLSPDDKDFVGKMLAKMADL
jgi:hypothetical protein